MIVSVSSHGGGLWCRAPDSHCVVVTGGHEDLKQYEVSQGLQTRLDGDTHLVIDRVPGHTVHRPHVAAEHCDGVVPLDVVNVDLGDDDGV